MRGKNFAKWLSLLLFLASQPAFCQTVIVMQGAEPTGLDPTFERGGIPTYSVAINIFDALILRTPEGNYVPGLAESYEWRDTDKCWIFHLRKNVKFHNGDPFTAHDVVFTIREIFKPERGSRRVADLKWIKDIEAIDDYTIKIVADPFPFAIHYFSELSIVPAQYFASVGPSAFAKRPIGTGPFKFVSWTPGYEIVLERNGDYFRGPAKIEKLIFRFVPSPATRVAALLAGEADLITDPPITAVETIRQNPNTHLGVTIGSRVIFIGFDTLQESPLQNIKVRQAINHAVDVDSIIQNLLFGYAKRAIALLTEEDFGFVADLKPYKYDPELAKALLSEAGYPNGFRIVLDTVSGRYINDLEVAQAIAGYLKEIGIEVEIRVLEFGMFNELLFTHKTSPMYLVGWGNTVFDAQYVYDFIVRTGSLIRTINDPYVDELLAAARSTVDQARRKEIFDLLVPYLHEITPFISLYKQPVFVGMSKRLQWTPRSDEFLWMWTAEVKQ